MKRPSLRRSRHAEHPHAWLAITLAVPAITALLFCVLYLYNNQIPDFRIPTPAVPIPNGYDDFVRAGKMAKSYENICPFSQPMSVNQVPQSMYAANARATVPVLALVRKALKEGYLYPAARSRTKLWAREHAEIRQVFRAAVSSARWDEMRANVHAALSTYLDLLELSVRLPHGAGVTGADLGYGCEEMTMRRFVRLIPRLSPADLRFAAVRLDRIMPARAAFDDIAAAEADETMWEGIESLRDPQGLGTYHSALDALRLNDEFRGVATESQLAAANPSEDEAPSLNQRWRAAKFEIANKTAILEEARRYGRVAAAACAGPYDPKEIPPPPDNMFATDGLLRIYWTKHELRATALLLVRCDIALRLFHADHARYPASLAELSPEYSRTVPIDPFSGSARAQLRYRLAGSGRGYVLYSIGPDMRDDGGAPVKGPLYDGPGDIVAGHLFEEDHK